MLNFVVHEENEDYKERLKNVMQENGNLLEKVQRGEEEYADSLGWLNVEEWAGSAAVAGIKALADKIRANADVFVLIGVGGSNNAARAVIEALKEDGSPEIVYAGNTLSPHAISKMLHKLKGKSVYVNCIAKNFETLEPGSVFRILRKFMYETYGEEASKRMIATGTPNSSLEQLCRDNGYEFLEFPGNIGGRYTAMSNVGLLPMAAAGIDICSLVKGAENMQKQLRTDNAEKNIAYRYAYHRNLLYNQGYPIEMLSGFEPQFRWFYKWWIQLFAESEGKDNKGIYPVASEYSEELHAIGQFVQEGSSVIFETFLKVSEQNASVMVEPDKDNDYFDYLDNKDFWDINETAYEATVKAHKKRLPCTTIEMKALDSYHFGELFYFFQFACYLSCRIMGVNPFDQPGVEAYKKNMFSALGKS